ncbi:mediator of RNA polymerase II transcription subunit 1 isoform X2 [Zootermopsis nevadensis]|uniref:mediator of RNA polymerase II transcription subunit 1 isoform X2 n=1 Tax=Zootermopsis nevadensis TaxID=136037 RepID=UPI000B8EB5B3|nr:mediator of RNA polymerase II transcription subunit 1 isoform X2 [Zootermopsis nevadensis]
MDKTKEWQMELLMEKLRSKAGQFKSFVESAKALRMSILEKRYPVDNVERNQLQKCLDILQHSIKVTSLQGMVERLESVTRQLGLKFSPGGSPLDWFISSDMFYLEVMLESTGGVKDVRIHHEGKVEQQSCEELVSCLSRGDFADFTAQLEGLASIYQLNAEKKVKCKAFSALQSLEADLGTLATLQSFIKEPFNLVHKSPVGILEKRRGGHAMKLTYLVPPYDLLDQQTNSSLSLSVEEVTSRNLGYSVMVCLEGSAAHKLQTTALISVNRSPSGKSTPLYASLSAANSATLPACFVLRLNNPMPMCLNLVRRIQQVTEMECGDLSTPHPLLSLVTQHASAGQLDCANNRGLFVTLPDQQHCFFMTESKNLEGILVSNIPFLHPAHVPQILMLLRQQALFNVLVSSCIRPASKHDLESVIMFEVTALSWQHLSISFEHPLEETMTTAELDLADISNIKCKVYGAGNGENGCTPEHASKVLQRCWSIPVTMRSLIRLWQSHNLRSNGLTAGGNLSLPPGSDPGRGHGGSMTPDFDVSRVKAEPDGSSLPHSQSLSGSGSRQGFGPDMSDTGVGFQSPGNPIESSVSNTFQFGALLSSQGSVGKGPVLLNMLSEQTPNTKKQRKRNNKDGMWRSPKRKQSEECEIVLESSSSDSTPLGTPTSRDAPMETILDCEEEKTGSDFGEEEIMPVEEVEEMIVRKPKKEKKTSPPTIILDLAESKNLVAPSVSITPITSSSSSFNSVLTGMGLERRPGIEIIPIVSTPATSLHSSITITPISSKVIAADDRNYRDRKSGKSRTEDKMRPDKKRNKRKREDSPSGCGGSSVAMGPPDKLPPKQDPLSKPVSVSIKPTESPPMTSVRPSSPASALRKVTSSPTHVNLSLTKSSSSKPSSSHQSPKHSPGYTTSSPKHHGTSSPKHQSSGGSGKPSMSALKSAASSPSTAGKSGSDVPKVKSSSSKDKDRKVSSSYSGASSGSGSSPKLKSSSVKLKQLDITSGSGDGGTGPQSGAGTPPLVTIDGNKSSAVPQVRNRKGSLSAVIDKLKSAQHQGPEPGEVMKEGRGSGTNPSSKIPGDTSGSIISSSKNPGEYMVKSSSEGIKITINKTRTKDSKSGVVKTSSSSSSSTGSGSPKTHTGLKPGVNSGPASKKPHQMLQQKSTSGNSGSSGISSSSSKAGSGSSSGNPSSKIPSTIKSTSSPVSGILSKSASKSSGSPKMSSLADANRRDNKPRTLKTGSDREKPVFSKGPDARKSSPIGLRDELEGERALKLVTAHAKIEPSLPPQLIVEGMIKSLDTKFQIPKLSARSSNLNEGDSKKQSSDKTSIGGTESSNRMDSGAKPIDLVGKVDGSNTSTKFPPLSKTDDMKGSKIPALASVTPALAISSLTTPTLKPPPTTAFPSVTSKLQDINLDTCPQISAPTAAPIVASMSSSSSEPTSGETLEVSRMKTDLPRSGQSSGNNAKEETTIQVIGKLENPVKSFSASNNNNDPSVLSTLHLSKTVDSSQTKFSSSSSQKQAEDSKKLVNLSDIPNKSTGLNKMTPAPTTSQEAAEILLDMSASSSLQNKPLVVEQQAGKLATVPERAVAVSAPSRRNTPPPPLPPPQPSVQVHILQSPAAAASTTASPVVITSPHSASPCSIDDELMDEALVGMGK